MLAPMTTRSAWMARPPSPSMTAPFRIRRRPPSRGLAQPDRGGLAHAGDRRMGPSDRGPVDDQVVADRAAVGDVARHQRAAGEGQAFEHCPIQQDRLIEGAVLEGQRHVDHDVPKVEGAGDIRPRHGDGSRVAVERCRHQGIPDLRCVDRRALAIVGLEANIGPRRQPIEQLRGRCAGPRLAIGGHGRIVVGHRLSVAADQAERQPTAARARAAALAPHMPWAPAPGGVDAEHRKTPGTPVA